MRPAQDRREAVERYMDFLLPALAEGNLDLIDFGTRRALGLLDP